MGSDRDFMAGVRKAADNRRWLLKAAPWIVGGVWLLMIAVLIAAAYEFATMDLKAIAHDAGQIARAAKEGFDGK